MGFLKKKPDPISQRAKALNAEIAALQAQINKLSAEKTEPAPQQNNQPQPQAPPQPSPPPPAPQPAPQQPRLRSTALPHHRHTVPASPGPAPAPGAHEPVFEELEQKELQAQTRTPKPSPNHDLGVRKNDFTSSWQRLKNHFRGPPTSNPKLVSYLAAGSIQGLRPLRYERRVARNRFIVLVICLVLVLWGLIAVFLRHK